MIYLQNLTDTSNLFNTQNQFNYTITVNKIDCKLTFNYIASTDVNMSWFLSIDYNGFIINNIRLVLSHNILSRYSKLLNFGIAVYSNNFITDKNYINYDYSITDIEEPILKIDLLTGRVKIFILTDPTLF